MRDAVETLREQQHAITRDIEKQQRAFTRDIETLREEKQKLEIIIYADKILLQRTLTQALTNLKLQRPDLFILSGQDQIAMLAKLLFENILH